MLEKAITGRVSSNSEAPLVNGLFDSGRNGKLMHVSSVGVRVAGK